MNKKEIIIIKRDGSKVPFDISKIKASIAFATEGIDVNPLQLEATLDQYIKNGMKTSDIQDNVIRAAVQLASPEQPLWLNVAGRALAMQMWANYKLRGKSFYEIVQYNIKKGEYTKDLLNFYTKEDIDTLGQYICHDRDLLHSHSSLITVSKKYLGKYELNQHMHMVSAMRFGQMESPENRLDFVIDLYDRLSFRKISLATPFMANLRKGGNTASCFILSVEDDLDSIFDNIKRIARISKNGGGLGIFLGYLRAKGSNIGSYVNASGSVTQWVKIINDTLVAVNQSFDGQTGVITSDGKKNIKDIDIGDSVLTNDGTYKEVTRVKNAQFDGNIRKITTSTGEVEVTEGHPVMVVDRTDDLKKLKQDIISGVVTPYWVDAKEVATSHLIISPK